MSHCSAEVLEGLRWVSGIDSPAVLDAFSLRMLLAALVGWLDQRQQDAVAYVIEENRILRSHLSGRIRLTNEERRRLARHGHRLGRRRLGEVATIVTPDTIFGGIDSSSRVSGRTRRSGAVVVLVCWPRFGAWSCGWPKRTRRGATPGSSAR